MTEVHWIKGEIAPPAAGEYYVIFEAKHDMPDPDTVKPLRHAGDLEVTGDWYDTEDGSFQSIGKNNPFWKVLAWAEVLTPAIPQEIQPRVRNYFGREVNWTPTKEEENE